MSHCVEFYKIWSLLVSWPVTLSNEAARYPLKSSHSLMKWVTTRLWVLMCLCVVRRGDRKRTRVREIEKDSLSKCLHNCSVILVCWKSFSSLLAKLWLVTFLHYSILVYVMFLSVKPVKFKVLLVIEKKGKKRTYLNKMTNPNECKIFTFFTPVSHKGNTELKIERQFINQSWNHFAPQTTSQFLVTLEENKKAVWSTLVIVKQRWNVRHARWK